MTDSAISSDAAGPPGVESQLPRVTAVVLNWHGLAETLQCLRALAALTYRQLSVLVIDNGSREFSAEEVNKLVPGAQYLQSETNLGFTGGSNLGMRQALSAGAEYVWFLNNDARPEPDALTELVVVARQNPPMDIVGPKILQAQDPTRLDSVALHVDLRSGRFYLIGHDEIDRGQYDKLCETRAVTGCAMLVSRAACEQLGGFDDRFFAYLEDADLCLRAHAAGFRVGVAPKARVLHNRPIATGPRQSNASLYYTARNHLLLMQRHAHGNAIGRGMRAAAVMGLEIAYALRGAPGTRAARLRAVYQGMRDYQRGIVGALRS